MELVLPTIEPEPVNFSSSFMESVTITSRLGMRVNHPLSNHFTVYAVGRRGHGESGDADTYNLTREVEDMVAIVESLEEPPHVFGHSFGGLLALEAAIETEI